MHIIKRPRIKKFRHFRASSRINTTVFSLIFIMKFVQVLNFTK